MRQLVALLSFWQNGSASDHFRGGKRGSKSESSKQACIAQAVRPAVSRGLICQETCAVGYLCPGHGVPSPLWDVAAQPCRGGAARASVRASEPLRIRSPTRALPGLACCQSHLRQTLDPVPAHLDRLFGAAWASAAHQRDSEPTALDECRHRRSSPAFPAQTGSARPLHHASRNAAEAADSDSHVPGVE